MTDKIYTLTLESSDVALIGGALSALHYHTKDVRVGLVLTEVEEQARSQGLDFIEELKRQQQLQDEREKKRGTL